MFSNKPVKKSPEQLSEAEVVAKFTVEERERIQNMAVYRDTISKLAEEIWKRREKAWTEVAK